MERNAVIAIVEPEQSAHQVLAAFDRRPSRVLSARVEGRGSKRVPANGRGKEARIEMAADKGPVAATVVVPDTIRSAGAVRLLAAFVGNSFHVPVRPHGHVLTITARAEQRPELVRAITAFARCFC